MIQGQFRKHAQLVDSIVTPAQRKAVTAFVQSPSSYLEEQAAPGFGQSYAPQSGAIFGILKQMKETFETNLATSQKEEMAGQEAYEDLKAAKETEIAAGQDQVATKTQELADTDEHLAQAKQDLDDTRNALDADQKFLMNLKETCQNTDAEWAERQKARQEEIKGCGEALSILSSDDAHDTFTRTFNFVQLRKTEKSRDQAEKMLYAAAAKFGNPRFSALASRVRLDAFGKLIDELTKSIETLTAEVAEMQTQMKRAGEDREMENSDFQKTVSDQRATKKILGNALEVLKAVYAKKSFMQARSRQEPAGPPPPPGFKKYEQSSGAGGVLGMLEQVIADTETLEKDAIQAETDAQKGYEAFVKDTNKSIEEKNRDVTNKSAAAEDLLSAQNEQQQLENENADLHKA